MPQYAGEVLRREKSRGSLCQVTKSVIRKEALLVERGPFVEQQETTTYYPVRMAMSQCGGTRRLLYARKICIRHFVESEMHNTCFILRVELW